MSFIWFGLGLLNLLEGGGAPSTSTPETTGLRMNSAGAAAIDLSAFTFATTMPMAQVSAIAGVAWMLAASVFKPAPAAQLPAADTRHWPQPQPQGLQTPSQGQPYPPQWQQQTPPHQHPDKQS